MSSLDTVLHLLLMLPAACLLVASPGEPGHAAGALNHPGQKGSTMGYGKQTIQFDFPDLSASEAPEDLIFVRILNPKLVSQDMLTSSIEIETDGDGKPLDKKAATRNAHEVIAGLVKAWHVYDPQDESEDPPRFPTPATPEMVSKLPMAIVVPLMTAINEAVAPK